MSTLDGTTTGELRKVAAEIQEARAHAIDRGAIIITAMVFVALVAVAFPAVDNDRFDVDGSRWAMAAASVFSVAAFIVGSAWVVDRRGKKRADEIVGRLDAMGTILCHNGKVVDRLIPLAKQTQIGMGMVSAQMEQLDARVDKVAARTQWLVADRERLRAAVARTGGNALSHSEYYEVYRDAIDDLGSIPPPEGGDGD